MSDLTVLTIDDVHQDGYVIAPDGSRAGLVWDVGSREIREIRRRQREAQESG